MSKVVGKSRESRRASKSRAPSSEQNVSTAVQKSESESVAEIDFAPVVADIRRRKDRALLAEAEVVEADDDGDGLTRCAHVFDNRKRLAASGVRGAFFTGLNRVDLLFYENKNGRLPAEIESAFTCACDELRRAGHDDTEAVVVLLHEQLADKFAETAEVHRVAVRLFHKYEHAAKIESSMPAMLLEPPPTEPAPWDEADHAQWEQTMREREAAQEEFRERFGDPPPSESAFNGLISYFHYYYQPSLKRLEECFELIVSTIRRIIKVGLKDRSAETVEAVKKLMEQKLDAIAAMMKNAPADGEKDQDASRKDGDGSTTHGQSCATSDGEQKSATQKRHKLFEIEIKIYAIYHCIYKERPEYRQAKYRTKETKRSGDQFFETFKYSSHPCGVDIGKQLIEYASSSDEFKKLLERVRGYARQIGERDHFRGKLLDSHFRL